jgi:polygalacturonase
MLNNVKDPLFGAKGDGVSDDRAAIQNAITDAALDPEKRDFLSGGHLSPLAR